MEFSKYVPLLFADEASRYEFRGRKLYDVALGRSVATTTGLIYDRTWPLSDEVRERVARRRGISVEELQAEWDEAKRLAMSVGDWVQRELYGALERLANGEEVTDSAFAGLARATLNLPSELYAERNGGELLRPSDCMVECGVAGGSETLSLYGRPDLMFLINGDVVLLDLKTTKKDMGTIWPDTKRMKSPFGMYMDVKANHAKIQLGMYGAILRRCGFRRIFPYLLEVDSNTVTGDGLTLPHGCSELRYRFVPLTYDLEERRFFSGIWECGELLERPREDGVSSAVEKDRVELGAALEAVRAFLPFSDRLGAERAGRTVAMELLDAGTWNVGELFVRADLSRTFFEALSEGLREAVIRELERYPEGDNPRFMGVPCRLVERVTYDFSGNADWVELRERLRALEVELKRGDESDGVEKRWVRYPVLEWSKKRDV